MSLRRTAVAPAASSCSAVTGSPSYVCATVIAPKTLEDLGWPTLIDHWAKRCATKRGEAVVRGNVLYDAIDPRSMSAMHRRRLDASVVIVSGLWGLVTPRDPIPDYKLKMGVRLGRLGRLALIDPVGLWRDDLPVKNWMLLSSDARRRALFADPEGEAARRFFDVPGDPAGRVDTLAQFTWAQACTGKFVWPIADRGFKNRIHRVAAPTLIVWGRTDGIIDLAYAHEFAKSIAGARIELIDNAGHLPHLENSEAVARTVRDFLGH